MVDLYILSIIAIIPFPLTYLIPYSLAFLYTLPILYQIYKTIKGKPINFKESTIEKLSILCFFLFIIDIFFFSRKIIQIAIHLTMALIVVKIFNLKKERDKNLFLLLLFFLITAGIANSFHITLFPYIILVFYFFIKIFMEQIEIEKKYSKKFSFFSIFLSLIICIPIFISFPRVKAPYFPGVSLKGETFGYDDFSLDLNEIESKRSSNEIIMRVKFKTLQEENLYIRVKTFSRYKNGIWNSPKPEHKLLNAKKPGYFSFSLEKEKDIYEIYAKSFFQYLPTFYGMASLYIPFEYLTISKDSSFVLPSTFQRRKLKYQAGITNNKKLHKVFEPIEEEKNKDNSEKLKELARQLFKNAKDDKEKIDKLVNYFYKNFTYTIEKIGLEDFLFKEKKGHCELFATASALLLREENIPTRIVVGYLGGEKHPWQNYLIVRASNAHAWVEAWVEGNWVLIDATPPSFRPSIKEGEIGAFIKYFYESLSFFWDRNVLGFTYSEQRDILLYFKDNLKTIFKIFIIISIFSMLFISLKIFIKYKKERLPFYLNYYKKLREKAIKKYNLSETTAPEKLSFILKDLKPNSSYHIEKFFELYLGSSFGRKLPEKKEMKYHYKKLNELIFKR